MTNTQTPPTKRFSIRPLFRVIFTSDAKRTSLLWFVFMLLAIAASASVTLGFGLVLKHLVDKGFVASNAQELNKTLIILLLMVAALAVSAFARLTLAGYVSERVAANLRTRAFSHLLKQDSVYFDSAHSHALASGLSADTALIQGVLATALPQILRNTLMVLGGLFMLFATSPALTILVVGVLPLMAVPVVLVGRIVRKNTRKAQDQSEKLGEMAGEALSEIQVVQSFTLERALSARYAAATKTALSAAMLQVMTRSAMVSVIILILFASICVVLWHGAHAVMQNTLSAGDLTSFVFYSGLVAAAFGVLGDMGASLYRASGALSRINDLMNLKPSIISGHETPENTPNITGEITFDNVEFGYNSPVLNGLNMHIPQGATIAIVGASGAGKTTIFKLLMRLYDPNYGRILLNGHDIKTLNLRHLRQNIAYVPQDAALFSGTVAENIASGKPDVNVSQDEIISAAKSAQAHDFIMSLPQGYDTLIGERGMTLSGGQRQRVAFARALLKSAPIMLLDEATSALDTANEQIIRQTLVAEHGKRSILIIAHRLSTVMQADIIFVLKNGQVIESGNHTTLIAQSGLYANMVQSQILSDTPITA